MDKDNAVFVDSIVHYPNNKFNKCYEEDLSDNKSLKELLQNNLVENLSYIKNESITFVNFS